MIKRTARYAAAIGTVLFLGGTHQAAGSSLILKYLATVSKIQVVSSTAGLRNQVPEMDMDALGKAVHSAARGALEGESLQVVDDSAQQVVISLLIRKSSDSSEYAFHVLVELQEEARLNRPWGGKAGSLVWVTTWKRSSLVWSEDFLTLERIAEEVGNGVDVLAEKIAQARVIARREFIP